MSVLETKKTARGFDMITFKDSSEKSALFKGHRIRQNIHSRARIEDFMDSQLESSR